MCAIASSVKCLQCEGIRTSNDEDILQRVFIFLRITETYVGKKERDASLPGCDVSIL